MYLLEIKLHCNKKYHWVLIKCVIVFFRRGLEMPSLSSSRSGTTCLSWPIDWWGSTRQTTVPSRWPSTPTTSSCPYRKSTPTAEAKSDCWSTDKQGHLFIYKYMIKRDQNINMCESPTCSLVVKGHLFKSPVSSVLLSMVYKPVGESSKILAMGLVICSCTYLKFYAALVN